VRPESSGTVNRPIGRIALNFGKQCNINPLQGQSQDTPEIETLMRNISDSAGLSGGTFCENRQT